MKYKQYFPFETNWKRIMNMTFKFYIDSNYNFHKHDFFIKKNI